MAYRITPEVLAPLDVREKNGYLREKVTLTFLDAAGHPDAELAPADGLIYLASDDNPAFLGDAPLAEIAQQIAQAHGPSGPNSAYLLNLARRCASWAPRMHIFLPWRSTCSATDRRATSSATTG